MKRLAVWLPLLFFAAFLVVVGLGLRKPSSPMILSQMIGKPVPSFALAPALPGKPGLASTAFRDGRPHMVNIFASWCIPCAAEAPQILALAERGIPIDAIAIRDRPEDIAAFLARWGDPYRAIGADTNSAAQMSLGSSGVPETFVIDGRGIIRYQHFGEIRPEQLPEMIQAYEAAR